MARYVFTKDKLNALKKACDQLQATFTEALRDCHTISARESYTASRRDCIEDLYVSPHLFYCFRSDNVVLEIRPLGSAKITVGKGIFCYYSIFCAGHVPYGLESYLSTKSDSELTDYSRIQFMDYYGSFDSLESAVLAWRKVISDYLSPPSLVL